MVEENIIIDGGVPDDSEDTEDSEDTKDTEDSEVVKKSGRPVGTTRYSNKPITLKDTADAGYVAFKDLLALFPHELRETLYNTPLPHSGIHDMADFADDMTRGAVFVTPIVCKGESCLYKSRCKLLENGIAPTGTPCPVEIYLINQWYSEWLETLEVDTSNKVERDQVANIIMCDLMLMRLRNKLSISMTGNIVYTPVGVDKNGNVILRADQAPEIAMEDRYMKLKARLQEELLATREARAKHGIMEDRDLAKSSAKTVLRGQKVMDDIIATRSSVKAMIGDDSGLGPRG